MTYLKTSLCYKMNLKNNISDKKYTFTKIEFDVICLKQEREVAADVVWDIDSYNHGLYSLYKDCRLKLVRKCDRLKHGFTVNNAMCHPDLHLLTKNFFVLLNDNNTLKIAFLKRQISWDF